MGTIILGGREVGLGGGIRVSHAFSLVPGAPRPDENWARKAPRKVCVPRNGTKLTNVVLHHDACLSAVGGPPGNSVRHSCYGTLLRRGLSTHFVIGNDGTVHQLLDPLVWSAWASGKFNQQSIAIDISNACELRYADRYDPPREIVRQQMQKGSVKWTAPYACQVETLVWLCRVLCVELEIPRETPIDAAGNPIMRYVRPVPHGVVGHLHLSKRKYDPFGLDWDNFRRRLQG